jgi:hypothetical protein
MSTGSTSLRRHEESSRRYTSVRAYQERFSDYLNPVSYKSVQLNYVQKPNDPAAQAEWFTKGAVLQKQVELKYGRWVAAGRHSLSKRYTRKKN